MKNVPLTTIYVVRHAESEANKLNLIGSDADLTFTGQEQAKQLGEKFRHVHFDVIFSSDLLRAKRTAEIVALERKLIVLTKKELRERDYGTYDGKSFDEYRNSLQEVFKKMETMSYQEIRRFRRYETFETDEEVLSRLILSLRELSVAYPGKSILVVSHQTLMRVFLIHLGFASHKELPSSPISNTGFIKIESDGVDFFLKETSGISKKNTN